MSAAVDSGRNYLEPMTAAELFQKLVLARQTRACSHKKLPGSHEGFHSSLPIEGTHQYLWTDPSWGDDECKSGGGLPFPVAQH